MRSRLNSTRNDRHTREEDDPPRPEAAHRPDAWYDHTVMSFVNEAPDGAPRTVTQIHDHVIQQGSHGAEVATTVLPDLVNDGELIEVEAGRYDVANRRTDSWYDVTVLDLVENASKPLTTRQVHDAIIEHGGHGAETVADVLPRLHRAGLITETEPGTWTPGNCVPRAWLETQVLQLITSGDIETMTPKAIVSAIGKDYLNESEAQAAIDALLESGLIEPEAPAAPNKSRSRRIA